MSTVIQSFIVSSKDKKARDNYITKLCLKEEIENFDISIIGEDGTIGIQEIRDLQKKIFLKPLKSKTKAIIVKNSENITIDAQNALLKILEEPPLNTIIILSTEKSGLLLPTIISRCKIIELSSSDYDELSTSEFSIFNSYFLLLFQKETGNNLKLAQDISKTKEEAVDWIRKMTIFTRQKLIGLVMEKNTTHYNDRYYRGYLYFLISLNITHKILKTSNVNTRFALENLFLSLG